MPAYSALWFIGRDAPDTIIDAADTVTEVRDVKHAFRTGTRAEKGVNL